MIQGECMIKESIIVKNCTAICLLMMLCSSSVVCSRSINPKIIGIVPARNEAAIIRQCLQALAMYTDAIIYLDDASEDDSVKIVESIKDECHVEKIITKKTWYRDEPGDKNALLSAGRQLGGTHYIVLDADEILSSNFLENNFLRNKILALEPGERLQLAWIQLWRSVKKYRFDNSIWTGNYKDFVFCDDGTCSYSSEFIHTSRVPKLHGCVHKIEGYEYGVLHFQWVNWENVSIKQAWYRCLERIRLPEKSVKEINERYDASIDETNIGYKDAPPAWFSRYSFFDANCYDCPDMWRKKQVLGWFAQCGIDYFKDLHIWHIDWFKA